MVALTPRCAEELGYEIPAEDAKKSYVEVSGRKGQGVKADDLMDRLEAAARGEIETRHPELAGTPTAREIGDAIAIGALRYFLLRFTRSTMIAFDFKDALSFEGETGPYVQYAVVRINGILRKGAERHPEFASVDAANLLRIGNGEIDVTKFLAAGAGDDLWELVVLAGSLDARGWLSRRIRKSRHLSRATRSSSRRHSSVRRQAPHSLGRGPREARVSAAIDRRSARPTRNHARLARDHRTQNVNAVPLHLQREIDERSDRDAGGTLREPDGALHRPSRWTRYRDGSTVCPRQIP